MGRPWLDRPLLAVLGGLAVIFLAPLNPWWVPTGDSEVFLTVARHLHLGEGLVYNGGPVAFIPPGWPLVLAGAFHVSSSVLWLKVLLIASMGGFLVLAHLTLRRFVPPATAAAAVVLAALCSPLYPLTFWLHSDALMALLAGTAGLLAVRLADGRSRPWLIAAVALLCVAGVTVRWAMVVQALVLAALALGSVPRPDLRWRRLILAGTVFAATFGGFVGLKLALPADETGHATALAPEFVPKLDRLIPAGGPMLAMREEGRPPTLGIQLDGRDVPLPLLLSWRIGSTPQWIGWTLWQPPRVVGGLGPAGKAVDYGVGGLALGLLLLAAVQGIRRGQMLWLGVVAYIVTLAVAWPHVNTRYLVPVLPYLIAGILAGVGELPAGRAWAWARWGLVRLFVAMLVLVNGGLWAVDVWVFRVSTAADFYARYEAGIHKPLIEAGAVLARNARPGEIIAASERYENLNERWQYKTAARVVTYISGHPTIAPPRDMTGRGVRRLQQWARDTGVAWYVHQTPLMPGRIWHFRVSPEVHEQITGWPPEPERQPYELYRMEWRPTEAIPDLRWLEYYSYAIRPETLDLIGRRIPGLPRGFNAD